MNPESALDISHRSNPRIVSTIKSADSIAIFGTATPLELPLAMFQVVMAFVEGRTTRQAFDLLDMDVDLDEFARIVDGLVDRDLLRRQHAVEDDRGLQDLLDPRAFGDAASLDRIGGWMRQGRAILVPDAVPRDLAERA